MLRTHQARTRVGTHTHMHTLTPPLPFRMSLFDGLWRPIMAELTPPFRRWRDNGRSLLHSNKPCAGDSVFVIFLGVFRVYIFFLGRIETRTRDRLCFQSIWTVWDISRDDRARIATCSLLIPPSPPEARSSGTVMIAVVPQWFRRPRIWVVWGQGQLALTFKEYWRASRPVCRVPRPLIFQAKH